MKCTHVFCAQTTCATPRQLADFIGGAQELVWLAHENEMDWCLCVIDVPETLSRAGLKWKRDRNPMIFRVER